MYMYMYIYAYLCIYIYIYMEHDLIFQDKLLFGVPITTAPFLLPGGTATKSCSPVGVVTWQDDMGVS